MIRSLGNLFCSRSTPYGRGTREAPGGGTYPAPLRFFLSALTLAVIILFLHDVGLPVYAQDPPRTVWDGVYNEEQAQRGRTVFLDQCANCHGRDLEGADMTPPLTGGAFMANWDGLTIGDLSDRIRISMPLNSPGSLSRPQITDVVAYILRFNQFPAGKEELPREAPAQKQILFKARP